MKVEQTVCQKMTPACALLTVIHNACGGVHVDFMAQLLPLYAINQLDPFGE